MTSTVILRTLIVTACLIAGSVYLGQVSRAESVLPHAPLETLSMEINGWTGRREPEFSAKVLAVLGVDDYIARSYFRQGRPLISLYVGYHASQRQGDAIHSPLNCLPGAGWQPLDQGRTVIPVQVSPASDVSPVELNRVIIAKGLDRQLVLYWYQSHRRVVANEYWGKIYMVLDAVRYNRTDAALVRVITPVLDDDVAARQAEERATTFVQAVFPLLGRHLPS